MSGYNCIPTADPEDAVRSSYTPLIDGPDHLATPNLRRSILAFFSVAFAALLLISVGIALSGSTERRLPLVAENAVPASDLGRWSRGVSEGVSEKSVRAFLQGDVVYPWTNAMLSWQRTAYHFQPEKNWMNGRDAFRFHSSF
ncbi:hypothetical protein ACLOJK_005489 [Asimina triloba]